MLHKDIYERFKNYFPHFTNEMTDWFPNGLNSVRIRGKETDFVFTHNTNKDWCLETVDSFINKIAGGKKMNVGLYDNINENK